MIEFLQNDWKDLLKDEFQKTYFGILELLIEEYYENSICYPPKELIFNAFNLCPLKEVKVVILGQDPYHGAGEANGLAFSVNDWIKIPPSLVNIFKELKTDLGTEIPMFGNLESWAKQGVLLLNTILTVEQNKAGSHQKKGWEIFTDSVIKKISDSTENAVFILWGNYAQKKIKLINNEKHLVLTSGHPSPLSANQGKWFGNHHFSKTNKYLISKNRSPINWQL